MYTLINTLVSAYKSKNTAKFEELVEQALNLPVEQLLILSESLENAYPEVSWAFDDVVQDYIRADSIW